jgi:hypothetical protein
VILNTDVYLVLYQFIDVFQRLTWLGVVQRCLAKILMALQFVGYASHVMPDEEVTILERITGGPVVLGEKQRQAKQRFIDAKT